MLTGYFVLHFHDAALVKDGPFMYSLYYLAIYFQVLENVRQLFL